MDWQTLRNQFMRKIGGDPPGPQLEDQLIAAYTNHPTTVERAIEKIGLAHQAGKIRSPWGALKAEVEKALDTNRNPTHDRGTARATAIARAEQWIRTAGLHYDRQDEILDELYGERGRLRAYPDTKPRMLELWNELAPAGQQLETQQAERLARWRQQQDTAQ